MARANAHAAHSRENVMKKAWEHGGARTTEQERVDATTTPPRPPAVIGVAHTGQSSPVLCRWLGCSNGSGNPPAVSTRALLSVSARALLFAALTLLGDRLGAILRRCRRRQHRRRGARGGGRGSQRLGDALVELAERLPISKAIAPHRVHKTREWGCADDSGQEQSSQ